MVLRQIIEMSKHSIKAEYDQLMSNVKYNAKDFTMLFTKFEKENNKKLTDKALASLGFYNSDNTLKNGALLFKDNYSEGKTMMHCSVFSGFDKGSDRIVSINKINTNNIFYVGSTDMLKEPLSKKFCLILDLDETLINFKVSDEDEETGCLRIRPGLTDFLNTLKPYYEIIVFTAGTKEYANPILNAIEERQKYFLESELNQLRLKDIQVNY